MANEPTNTAAAAGHPANALSPMPAPSASPMVLGSDAFRMGLEPANLAEAYNLATMIASTRICGVESPEDALLRIMTGRSLGLSTMQSLRGVSSVKNRPFIDASLMHAICLQSPLCEEFVLVSSDEKQATYRAKRRGQEAQEWTFTIEDAERQGLVGRGETPEKAKENNYNKVPKDMLRARCKSTLARMVFPDLLFGMYTREELEAGIAEEPAARPTGEIQVEVIPPKPASPVQAAARDFAKEAEALKAEIAAATTKEARSAVRKKVASWDGIEPFKTQVREAYNASKPAGAETADGAQATLPGAATEAGGPKS